MRLTESTKCCMRKGKKTLWKVNADKKKKGNNKENLALLPNNKRINNAHKRQQERTEFLLPLDQKQRDEQRKLESVAKDPPRVKLLQQQPLKMSNTITKNIILSQPKVGLGVEVPCPALVHSTTQEETETVVKIEIPGIDPSTVNVNFEYNVLVVTCEKGSASISLVPNTDYSKIQADILWGLLTIRIPHPEEPQTQTIKVSIHDSVRKNTHKESDKKFTEEE